MIRHFKALVACSFSLALTAALAQSSLAEFRSIDGSGNNIANPADGQAGTQLIRLLDSDYQDGVSIPRGGAMPSSLPSPRLISNIVADQNSSVTNFLGASDWLWQWGQFLDHDMDFTPGSATPEPFHIPVPKTGDPDFNPGQLDNLIIPFNRSQGAAGTGTSTANPRQQLNEITSYIDASMVYGSDPVRAAALRSTTNPGMLEISLAQNGEVLPMKNTPGLPNDNGGSTMSADFYLSGDVRANEQIGLTASHTLFVREHNRLIADFESRMAAGDQTLITKRDAAIAEPNGINDEADFLYESARKVVGAQIQKITYEEFLPLLIGGDLGSFAGYDDTVNASISNEFATAAYRLGHTLLSPTLKRPGVGDIALKDAFFNPSEVETNGIDALLVGLAQQQSQEVDNMLVDGVRNFLFGPPGAGGLDLASLNIQRGRDHGLPGYAETHDEIFGTSINSFSDLGSAGLGLFDDAVVALLEQAYDSVDQIDLWIGGISELPDDHGGLLGPTFTFFMVDQFGRSRDGDRFYYEGSEMAEHLRQLDTTFDDTLLSDIILRNSSVSAIQSNVFIVVPEPTAICLAGLMSLGWICRRGKSTN